MYYVVIIKLPIYLPTNNNNNKAFFTTPPPFPTTPYHPTTLITHEAFPSIFSSPCVCIYTCMIYIIQTLSLSSLAPTLRYGFMSGGVSCVGLENTMGWDEMRWGWFIVVGMITSTYYLPAYLLYPQFSNIQLPNQVDRKRKRKRK